MSCECVSLTCHPGSPETAVIWPLLAQMFSESASDHRQIPHFKDVRALRSPSHLGLPCACNCPLHVGLSPVDEHNTIAAGARLQRSSNRGVAHVQIVPALARRLGWKVDQGPTRGHSINEHSALSHERRVALERKIQDLFVDQLLTSAFKYSALPWEQCPVRAFHHPDGWCSWPAAVQRASAQQELMELVCCCHAAEPHSG
jgi:hypothetical protein